MSERMERSAHVDTFARDNLPPQSAWPDFINLDGLGYPKRLNCAVELLDRWIARGHGAAPAFITDTESWTYQDLFDRVNRIANVLTGPLGLLPGNRVLLRSANTPMMVACYLAVLKAGGVVVATMPLLRARELGYIAQKAAVTLALCDARLTGEMRKMQEAVPALSRIVTFNGAGNAGKSLEALMADASDMFDACDTAADDVCLFGFTSGTTGEPKCTMHFHRDMLAICDCYGAKVLQAGPEDRFVGSPPLAFTFGLGGLVLFPMRVGASSVLVEAPAPGEILKAIDRHKPTICFTAPTAYRAMLSEIGKYDISSLKKCVSAGEACPKPTWDAFFETTGLKLMDGIGATELLHIFIASPLERIRPGATGEPVPGYEAKVILPDGSDAPAGAPGRLAVRGPTGCRYLADPRQARYVADGWNITGDTYIADEDGYFWYQARNDDMIISAGYNIAGPEVEAGLMSHPAVAEAGVVGMPDAERGQIAAAYVVLNAGHTAGDALAKALQDHVKAELAPYKYPRKVIFLNALPRTETGKLQRFRLRDMAAGGSP